MLEQIQTIEYLGIIIDSKLNYREHIIHISIKSNKIFYTLSKSEDLSWG